MRRSYLVSTVVLLLIVLMPATPISQAQEDNICAQLVEQALSDVGTNCANLGGNSVCFGYGVAQISFIEPIDDQTFNKG